jgi:hypothetical protein
LVFAGVVDSSVDRVPHKPEVTSLTLETKPILLLQTFISPTQSRQP